MDWRVCSAGACNLMDVLLHYGSELGMSLKNLFSAKDGTREAVPLSNTTH